MYWNYALPEQAPAGAPAGQPAEVTAACYLPAAPLVDILQKQIAYLFAHAGTHRDPECPDCARLEQVERCLLKPFYPA